MTPQFRSIFQQQHPHQKCDDTTVQINLPTTTSSPLLQGKLLTTMLPTPEEKHKIQEATIFNPYLPLGSAEQFLMTLSSISELPARLKLWIFKLDSENMEKIDSITRASKVDFKELSHNIAKIEVDCKESWDHLKAIAKHDGPMQIKLKFQQFLVWLGSPQHLAQDIKVQQVCSTINEFALEYRTCRERVLQQTQKKANHRERNKTRGKMIVEGGNSYKEVASVCSTNGRRTRVLSPDGDVQAFLLASATLARMKWMVPVNVPISQTRMMMWDRNVDRSTLEAGEKVLALEPIHVKICMASCCDLNMVWGKFSGVRYKTHTCEQEKNECRVHSNPLKGLKLY
nr:FH1/FH2 domain-containing protein 3-like isoform X2 [Cherax quadricarinatus]